MLCDTTCFEASQNTAKIKQLEIIIIKKNNKLKKKDITARNSEDISK
jgi:hypothetical protein